MTKPDRTEIIVLLDRSGSMQEIRADMEGGFNSFIEEQKKVPGECYVSLYQFDDKFEQVFAGYPLSAVPKLRLLPRGNTALYDALDRTINLTGDRLALKPEWERPSKVVMMIITDGEENASRFATLEQVKAKIEHQEKKYSWGFIYLGSSPTTARDAVSLGIQAYSNYISSPGGVVGMSNVANNVMRAYRLSADAKPSDLISMLPATIDEEHVSTTYVSVQPPVTTTTADPPSSSK